METQTEADIYANRVDCLAALRSNEKRSKRFQYRMPSETNDTCYCALGIMYFIGLGYEPHTTSHFPFSYQGLAMAVGLETGELGMIERLHDEQGFTFDQIADVLEVIFTMTPLRVLSKEEAQPEMPPQSKIRATYSDDAYTARMENKGHREVIAACLQLI